jgi:hypothetical protein
MNRLRRKAAVTVAAVVETSIVLDKHASFPIHVREPEKFLDNMEY